MLSSYCKVYNLGHKAIADLFKDPVIVQEKIDGSQFSFGIIDGKLQFRSHHCEVFPEHAGMFQLAVDYIRSVEHLLHKGWIYRGEFLSKPKHNVLAYDRVPKNNIIIFDIDMGTENYIGYKGVRIFADYIGLETVNCFRTSFPKPFTVDEFKDFLGLTSFLGGTTIEGVVIKNYNRFGIDGHCLMGKYVSEKFKEKAKLVNKHNNRSIIEILTIQYRTEARWNKAIQHLKERGLLKDEPADIGNLLKEIDKDVLEEDGEEIKEQLFNHFWREIKRGIARGFPEFYKNLLLTKQFGDNKND
jgi:hypothetical protein